MTITPQEIQSKQFHVRLRGFDVDEVDKFLEKISEEFMLQGLEHKQAFERIDNLEKEIANFRNKEQAFQTAILSAHRISDEMQERSRRESEETLLKAKQEATALETKSREESETTLQQAAQEAQNIKELAEKESREMVADLGAKILLQTAEVNRLVALKEAISADLRHLLESHLQYLEEGTPAGLVGLTPLPDPDPALLPPQEFVPTHLQPERWNAAPTNHLDEHPAPLGAAAYDPNATMYERIDLSEDLLEPEPMAKITPDSDNPGDTAILEISDIEGLDLEDISEPEISTSTTGQQTEGASTSPDDDMFFTLEDPLDDLEPSISIRGNNDLKRR